MDNTSRKTSILICGLIVLATAAFIFGQSLQDVEGTWSESNAVAALFEPVLRRAYNLTVKLSVWLNHPLVVTYEVFVRKLAHFIEYFCLGAECAGITAFLTRRVVSPYVWADLFIVLMIAVIDEFVQTFVGRTGRVADVLLDFSGATAGMIIAFIVAAIIFSLTRRQRRQARIS